ncbi:phage portal protein [Ancylobacter sonchi]
MRGILSTLFGAEQKDNSSYGSAEDVWRDLFGGHQSQSGVSVTWKRALEVTTALRCATIIAEGICSVPFKVYRKVSVDNRVERQEDQAHALTDIMSTEPNEWQSGFEFRETIGLHLALCQNAYVFVNRVRGDVAELIPFEPGRVEVTQNSDWTLSYAVTAPDGARQVFPAGAIWHIKARAWNGYMGLETLRLAREALGLAISTEASHARMHVNGARPSGVLSVEGPLEEAQLKVYRKWIEAHYSGVRNTGRTLILDRAAKWQTQQMSGVDAQHLQTRGFQIEEVCRAMGVLPIMVGYTGDKNATFASSEQLFLAHVTYTVRPWHRRLESSADRWLLTKKERQAGRYMGFVDTELLRGDHKARSEFYKSGIEGGWLLRSDARRFEDLPYVAGIDRPIMPANFAVVREDGVPIMPAKVQTGGPTNER